MTVQRHPLPEAVRLLAFAALPALAMSLLYGWLLGDRSDYLGHFAAGYGGTLGVTVIAAAVGSMMRPWVAHAAVIAALLASIALGAMLKLTIFRIARFDEVDFCNQSLGAALAAAATLGIIGSSGLRTPGLAAGLLAAGAFLLAGFHYAFA